MLGFPDASHRNNDDGSSQQSMTVFLEESRERSSRDGMTFGSLIDCESQNFLQSCALHYCGGAVILHEVLWVMSVSPSIVDGHVRCSSKHRHEHWCEEPRIRARTIQLPEQKKTIHSFSSCEGKLVQEVFVILLTFQPKLLGRLPGGGKIDHSREEGLLVDLVQNIYAHKKE